MATRAREGKISKGSPITLNPSTNFLRAFLVIGATHTQRLAVIVILNQVFFERAEQSVAARCSFAPGRQHQTLEYWSRESGPLPLSRPRIRGAIDRAILRGLWPKVYGQSPNRLLD